MKPKQKEVTMWVIWSPITRGFNCDSIKKRENTAWVVQMKRIGCDKKTLIKLGYRAVKGKFVWEEK